MIDRPHPWSKGLWRCLIKNVSTVNNYVLIWVDRPTRLLNTCMVWFSRLCYNLAFTSMSLSERHFLYDITDGSLKTWWSNSCFCIRYHFLVRFLFDGRSGRHGWRLLCLWMEIKLHFSWFLSCFLRPYEYVTGLSNVFWVVAGHYVCYCLSIFKTNLNLNIWYF